MNMITKTVLSLMALTMLTIGTSFAASKDGCCDGSGCCNGSPCCQCCDE